MNLRALLSLLLTTATIGVILFTAECSAAPKEVVVDEPELITLNIWVHVLESDESKAIHCTLTDDEVRTLVDSANRYWKQAGVRRRTRSVKTRKPPVMKATLKIQATAPRFWRAVKAPRWIEFDV